MGEADGKVGVLFVEPFNNSISKGEGEGRCKDGDKGIVGVLFVEPFNNSISKREVEGRCKDGVRG